MLRQAAAVHSTCCLEWRAWGGILLHEMSQSSYTACHCVPNYNQLLLPSAGKTTFLAVLRGAAGTVGRQHGRVLVNGREMRLSALRDITGFVPQEASALAV